MEGLTLIGYVGAAAYVSHLIRKKIRKKKPRSSSFRSYLVKTYGHKCMVCGYKKSVCAHHIKSKAKGGSDDPRKNGILLCPNCHADAHSGRLGILKLRYCKRKARKIIRPR
jgi:predicted HNH restriction endonuclease